MVPHNHQVPSSITQHNHLVWYHIITMCWSVSPISIIPWYTPIITLKIPVITTSPYSYTPSHPKYQTSHHFTLPQSPKIPVITTSLYIPSHPKYQTSPHDLTLPVTQNTSHHIILHSHSNPKYQTSSHHFKLPQSPKIPDITTWLYTPTVTQNTSHYHMTLHFHSHPKYQSSPHDLTCHCRGQQMQVTVGYSSPQDKSGSIFWNEPILLINTYSHNVPGQPLCYTKKTRTVCIHIYLSIYQERERVSDRQTDR